VASRSSGSWVLEINPEAKWLYAWDSGATKAQRLTRHLLEAIVVTPRPSHDDLQVLATARSPTFTFVSFRRAADNELSSPDQSLLFRALTWELHQRARPRPAAHDTAAVHPIKRPPPESFEESGTFPPTKKAVVSRNPPTVELVTNRSFRDSLGLLLAWVLRLPARRLEPILPSLEADIMDRGRDPRQRSQQRSTSRPGALCVAAQLVWWLRTDERVEDELHAHASHAVCGLGNPAALQQAYDQWLDRVYQRCNTFLETHAWTWSELCTHIPDAEARSLSHKARHALDYHSFVSVVRQLVVTGSSSRHQVPPGRRGRRVWTCSVQNITVRPPGTREITVSALDLFSIDSLFAFWIQLCVVRVNITMEASGTACLRVQPSGSDHPGLALLLDCRHRCFATLPHGESSLGASIWSGLSIGDYVGSIARSVEGSPVVRVTFYAWPKDDHTINSAYRSQCVLTFPHDDTLIRVSVRVERGAIAQRSSTLLETLPLQEKLALVDDWCSWVDLHVPYRPLL
jgi:hypothetical protein